MAEALRALLRRGLPAAPDAVTPALLDLRGVAARAADPADEASRRAALDGLLRSTLARFPDVKHSRSVRALFGMAPAEPGWNLTRRRDAAAAACGMEVNHFRKRIEPRLVEVVAASLVADDEAFTRTSAIAPRLTAATARQRIPAEPFAWEVAEHEAALTAVWAAIYALRAELLTIERLLSLGAGRSEVVPHAVDAAWAWGRTRRAALDFTDGWDTGLDPHALVALAGWAPALAAPEADRLTQAAAAASDRTAFLTAVRSDIALSDAWIEPFFHTTNTDID